MSKLLSLPAIGLGLGLIGCSTTSDVTYADRNNVDVARSRCVEVARTIGYSDVLSIPSKGMVRLSGKFD
jgi:hypothetical protein